MNEQGDLFGFPPVVIARRNDPDTSQEAAVALAAQQAKLQRSVQTVVAILKDHGELTDFRLSELWPGYWPEPFSESLPRKARHWAREANLVEHAGYGLHQNRRVRTWKLR